ncbi:3-dehydroquinate synthase [Myxococcota bacterium]|nr:3-dehydroquinate synthase [Myxococcota bacterium]
MGREIRLDVAGDRQSCLVRVGPMDPVPWEGPRCLVVDRRVARRHPGRLPPGPVLEVRGGESLKTVRGLQRVWSFLEEVGADRDTLVIGMGGGTVTDLVGLAAATWHRGIPCGFVATTLLAQVDAALGGKNGIDWHGGKNQVGTVRQPRFVLCDPALLSSLGERDYRSGLAEAVKTALLEGEEAFGFLEAHREALLARDRETIEEAVFRCAAFKVSVVREDPGEAGRRRILNLGHTMGHAWEMVLGLPHGEAVSAGLVAACDLSVRLGLLDRQWRDRVAALLDGFGLPTRLEAPAEALVSVLTHDKKRRQGEVQWVLLQGPGRPRVQAVPLSEVPALHREAPVS